MIEIQQWYTDSTYEMRTKHPSLATRRDEVDHIERSYSADPEGITPGGKRIPIDPDFLRRIEPGWSYDLLRVDIGYDIYSDDVDKTFETNRVKGVIHHSKRMFGFTPHDEEQPVAFDPMHILRIDVVDA